MTDAKLVLHKLQRLREYLSLARRRRPDTADELARDVDRRDALALAVLVAVQEAIDVAYHVASDEGWGLPDSHSSALALLADHGVVPRELAIELSAVARVRNRIAHGYASVDHARLWSELPRGLDALEEYAAAVARWLPA
jgi:uncharacterized protein YutE (UPF0331/DUF86 family)